MALSFGAFTRVLTGQTMSFAKSSAMVPLKLRMMTSATVSEPATKTKKPKPRGIMKTARSSSELQAFLGGAVPEIPRTNALKLIGEYIKQNNLQDPKNKKIIVCDDLLKRIFAGKDRVRMHEITALISSHFLK